jgi:transketolase
MRSQWGLKPDLFSAGFFLYHSYSIKPIDETTIRQAADDPGAVITVEDHYPEGGLGDAVLNALAGRRIGFRKLAVNTMPRSGDPATLMEYSGIGAANIVAAVKEMVGAV